MVGQKKKVVAAAGGSSASAMDHLQQENAWLAGMEKLIAWMYEHCSRHQMEEAVQGIIQSAERLFNLPQDRIMELAADPYSELRRRLSKGKYKDAYSEFEFICPQEMDRSANSVFSRTLNAIKIQMALDTLRTDSQDIESFKSNVNKLFPVAAKKKGTTSAETKAVDQIRTELLAVKAAQVPSLLNKYSEKNFSEITSDFWAELKKHRTPTVLEALMNDIESGKYEPRIALHTSSAPDAVRDDDEIEALPLHEQAARPSPKKQPAAAAAESPAQKPGPSVKAADRAVVSQRGKAAPPEAEPMVLSAWDLRKALVYAGDTNDESEFAEIHQQSHPEVMDFLASRSAGSKRRKPEPGGPESEPEPNSASAPEPVLVESENSAARKRKRVQAAEDGGGEVPADIGALLKQKRREDTAAAGAGRTGRSRGEASKRETEKENKQPAAEIAEKQGSSSRTPRGEPQEVVKQLREDSRKLLSSTRDPLEEVRKISRTAGADLGGKQRIRMDPASPGQAVNWNSDGGSDDEERVALPSPTVAYRPRARLSRGSGGSPAAGASSSKSSGPGYMRWTAEEVENLKAGVARIGEGNWQKILEQKKFHKTRSAVDLKDKWRNLKKYNHV